jgi:hypothetical protein
MPVHWLIVFPAESPRYGDGDMFSVFKKSLMLPDPGGFGSA